MIKISSFKNLAATVCAGVVLTQQNVEAQPLKPSILFILVDDLGYHDLSCTGSKFYETPNIDTLAKESVTFSKGYASCPVSSPSRASIMTGRAPVRHGITDWIGAKSGEKWRKVNRHTPLLPANYVHQLDAKFVTLPEALRENGYKTFIAGKWHLGGDEALPEDRGFDINMGACEYGKPNGGYFSPYQNRKLADGPTGENLSIRLADETAKFIRENKDKPFFAYLSFYAVHGPLQTSEAKWLKYRDKAEKTGIVPTGFIVGKYLPIRQQQDNPVYAGLVEDMDESIGRVLSTLKETGLYDNTVIIFTSDNGGVSSGDSYSTSNAPLRGGKGTPWEGGVREPIFIKAPGISPHISDAPAIGSDFFPTLLELTGAPLRPNDHLDGVSLVPALQGKTMPERSLYWHYPHYGNQGGEPYSSVLRGDWKLIRFWEDRHDELYNLKDDPSETRNVAAIHLEQAQALGQQLSDYLAETRAALPEKDLEYNPALEQEYLSKIREQELPKLETERTQMFQRGWEPDPTWWHSKVTRD